MPRKSFRCLKDIFKHSVFTDFKWVEGSYKKASSESRPHLKSMRSDWPLTEKEVETYRHLYYEVYKPLVKQGVEESEIPEAMEKAFSQTGWTWSQFEDYKSIDLMQRLVFEYSHELVQSGARTEPMTSKPEYRSYDPNYGALILKDETRSEDPLKKH